MHVRLLERDEYPAEPRNPAPTANAYTFMPMTLIPSPAAARSLLRTTIIFRPVDPAAKVGNHQAYEDERNQHERRVALADA